MRFKANNILTLLSLYVLECLCFVHEHLHYFNKYLTENTKTTRKVETFTYPFHRTSLLEEGCMYQCLRLYNSLPFNYKHLPIKHFKKQFKVKLIKAELYSITEFSKNIFN